MTKKPVCRKLRGYAFDPSLSLKMDTVVINEMVYNVRWEDEPALSPGPCGEYVEVIDYDPTVEKYYSPVNLNDAYILAQDGLPPSPSNPQFHQQMLYAVAMTTIKNFESALGREVLWSPHVFYKDGETKKTYDFVQRLRLYPHALREANAYYSPQKKAILFGYFSASPADVTLQMPGNLTFSCLSHDIIAHEITHAILDGLHPKYTSDSNPDVLAFHEAFADIVALFQHFSFPDVLKNQIAATKGDLSSQNMLGKLAKEFGIAMGNYDSLRDAIGYIDPEKNEWKPTIPTGNEYRTVTEPHARGSILVAAIFEAFLSIYKDRVADLLRIASAGASASSSGELHPDLVNRLADEAAKASTHVLSMCVRALDYCPPVDINFGDFLRAIITADIDLVPDDKRNYRLAFIDAFRRRGIYPTGIKHLSVESLSYAVPKTEKLDDLFTTLVNFLKDYSNAIIYAKSRKEIFDYNNQYIAGSRDRDIFGIHSRLYMKFDNSKEFECLTGLMFSDGWEALSIPSSHSNNSNSPRFAVQSLHVASRVGPTGKQSNQVIMTLVQHASPSVKKNEDGSISFMQGESADWEISGGCTLIFDLRTQKLCYAISKPLVDVEELKNKNVYQLDRSRCQATYNYQNGSEAPESTRFQSYFGTKKTNTVNEPFCFLHTK